MADVKSYAWAHQLAEPVSPGGSVEVPTPGFDNPESYDTSKTEVVYVSTVLRGNQVSAAWEGDFSKVTLTNKSESDTWEPLNQVYVTVPGVPFDADNVEESFSKLQAQVSDHETRITTLETTVGAKVEVAKAKVEAVQQHQAAKPAAKPVSQPPPRPGPHPAKR